MLWHNNGLDQYGRVYFTDVAVETGTFDGGWGWGAKFFDYDNDGDLDLLAVNGFISAGDGNYWYDLASWTVLGQDSADAANWPTIGDRSFSGYEHFRLWRNDGFASFSQRAAEVGLDSDRDGRGVVCFDYDNDGDLDVFVANHDQAPQLFRNNLANRQHWLTVKLETDPTTGVNRDAIGARVIVVTEDGLQLRERDGGNGYCAQSDPRLHFGLGDAANVILIEVRWPDAGLQYLENVPADRIITVRQDPSLYATDAMVVIKPPKRRPRNADDKPAAPLLTSSEIDEILAPIEQRIRANPASYALTDAYRARCVILNRHDRAIDFLKDLVDRHPEEVRARIALSVAYVDKIPTCGGLAAIVSKGTLARKGLDVLDDAIQKFGSSWALHYARGMNHLHWPRALRHSDDAVDDITRCLADQRAAGTPAAKAYYERTYLILGDAHAKNKSFVLARKVWRDGLKAFPHSRAIKRRVALKTDSEILASVERERGLENPIDTNFAFLETEP